MAHLWRLLALWGMQLETRNPSWNFIRYEDLAADPEQEFCRLCGAMDIEFDDRKRALLRSMNRPSRSEPGSEQVKDTYRMRSELPDPDTVLTPADDELVKSILLPRTRTSLPRDIGGDERLRTWGRTTSSRVGYTLEVMKKYILIFLGIIILSITSLLTMPGLRRFLGIDVSGFVVAQIEALARENINPKLTLEGASYRFPTTVNLHGVHPHEG